MDPLELEDSRGGSVREPNWGAIGKNRADEGFVGGEEGFPLLAPGGASKGFKDTESIAGFGGYIVDVGGEGELGVEGDTQNAGGLVERKRE